MTAKDQAVVPFIQSIKIPTDTMEQEFQSYYLRGYKAGQLATQPPAPDCRTCENLESCKADAQWLRNYCTNGNQYQEAPKVVLWGAGKPEIQLNVERQLS
jgi:hypothetical protein